MGQVRTKTSEALKKKILEIMDDEKIRDINEIKEELWKMDMKLNQDYNTNHLSGVLNQLKKRGAIKNTERGYYQKDSVKSDAPEYVKKKIPNEKKEKPIKVNWANVAREVNKDLQKTLAVVNKKLKKYNGYDIVNIKADEKKAFDKLLKTTKELEQLVEIKK